MEMRELLKVQGNGARRVDVCNTVISTERVNWAE